MVLYDARGTQHMSSTDMSIMCSSGSAGSTMTRKVYDETNPLCGWIQRPAYYGQPPPRVDFERILEAEDRELERRRQTMAPGEDLVDTAWVLNRKPNSYLSGDEGLEPYELYSIMLAEMKQLAAIQQCTCYCSFDVRAFGRSDRVVHPPKSKRKGRGDGKKGGPGLSSGPQEKRN